MCAANGLERIGRQLKLPEPYVLLSVARCGSMGKAFLEGDPEASKLVKSSNLTRNVDIL
jgi:hypothetical protein